MMAVVVPSRGRPGNIAELIDAWRGSFGNPTTALYVAVDADDPELDAYRALDLAGVTLFIVPSTVRRLGGVLNHVAPIVAEGFDIVGFLGDDHRPRTRNWDVLVDIAMGEGASVVYGNDLVHGPGLPTAVFMDARIVRTLGHFVLPGQIHLWMDNYWKTLGEQLGSLRYLHDVIIEHVHPITGKAEWDEHYIANNAQAVWENDERIYMEWVATQMPADIARVKSVLA